MSKVSCIPQDNYTRAAVVKGIEASDGNGVRTFLHDFVEVMMHRRTRQEGMVAEESPYGQLPHRSCVGAD